MTHPRRCRLPLLVAKLVHAYERVQVELHGKYSVERVAEVHAYERTYATWQCVLVLLVTPLPGLAVIVLMDLVPLNAPQDGYAHNGVFWVRAFVVAFAFVATIFEQMRRFVTGLPLSTHTLWGVSMLIAACSMAWGYLTATVVGFPIPFTILLCTPCAGSMLVGSGLILWSPLLRESSLIRQDVLAYVKIVVVQFALTIVYPAYNFFFSQLAGIEQTLVALLLPVLKLVIKNAISAVFSPRLEDFKPEVVIFNVEVFHALFVSFCMQSSTSWSTTMVLMGVDFVHAWFSLRDVEAQLRTIDRLDEKMHTALAKSEGAWTIETQASIQAMTLIEKAMYYVHYDEAVGRDPAIRMKSVHTEATGVVPVYPVCVAGPPSNLSPPSFLTENAVFRAVEPVRDVSSQNWRTVFPTVPTRRELIRLSSVLSHVPEDKRSVLNMLTTEERIAYVTTTLQVLHIAEFLLLIEFVEVVIPVVYCAYLMAMFHLPNRVYYPQLARMDTRSLFSTIGSVLGYAALEFVSFIILSVALRRKLQLSPVHQLAFVVHSQWNLVQSKLILWIMFAVQISLQHFGYDYSFRFQWLHAV